MECCLPVLIIFAIDCGDLKTLLFICSVFLPLTLFSQHTLMLEKLGTGHWYQYLPGDEIMLQLTHEDGKLTATISSICDTGFTVDMNTFIPLDDVKIVWREFPRRKKSGNLVIIAGGVLVAITSINNIAQGRTVIDPLYVAIGAGISATGLLWRSTALPRYKIGSKWKLKVLDHVFM